MKRFLLLVAVLACCAFITAEACSLHQDAKKRAYPAIGVKIVTENSWSGCINYLPEVDGASTSFTEQSEGEFGKNNPYAVRASYKVVSSPSGVFFVLAHFDIVQNGSSTEVDKALPILTYTPSPPPEEKLKRPTWTKLDDRLSAFAFLSDERLRY